jgi:hypothetical protein
MGEASLVNLVTHTLTLSGTVDLFNSFGDPGVTGSGTFETTSSSTTGVDNFFLGGTVDWKNYGTVSETGALTIGDGGTNAATFTNEAKANYDFTQDNGIGIGANLTSQFVNDGTLSKLGGTGDSSVAVDVVNDGAVKITTGEIEFDRQVTGTGALTMSTNASLDFDALVSSTESVTFTGGTSQLRLTDSAQFAGSVTGFGGQETLDLANINPNSDKFALSYSGSSTSGVLTVTDGTTTANVQLFGQYVTAGFGAGHDSGGGTLITYVPPTTHAHQLAITGR